MEVNQKKSSGTEQELQDHDQLICLLLSSVNICIQNYWLTLLFLEWEWKVINKGKPFQWSCFKKYCIVASYFVLSLLKCLTKHLHVNGPIQKQHYLNEKKILGNCWNGVHLSKSFDLLLTPCYATGQIDKYLFLGLCCSWYYNLLSWITKGTSTLKIYKWTNNEMISN